jgi:hypothetical protein
VQLLGLLTNTSASNKQGQNGKLHMRYCITCRLGKSGQPGLGIYANEYGLLVKARRQMLIWRAAVVRLPFQMRHRHSRFVLSALFSVSVSTWRQRAMLTVICPLRTE